MLEAQWEEINQISVNHEPSSDGEKKLNID